MRPVKLLGLILFFCSSVVGAFVLLDESSMTGPSDSQVIQDMRQNWQKLSGSKIQLHSVYVDERDIMAADRVRFEVSLLYQLADHQDQRQDKISVIYRLFGEQWREHRY